MSSSHARNPCGPEYAPVPRTPPVANWPPAAVFSLVGAGVVPSPRISVVMPCVTLLTERPSPRKLVPLWMSMKPGETTSPRASMRCFAGNRLSDPAGPIRAMWSPAIATSPGNDAAPGPVDHSSILEHDVERRRARTWRGRWSVRACGERAAGE